MIANDELSREGEKQIETVLQSQLEFLHTLFYNYSDIFFKSEHDCER